MSWLFNPKKSSASTQQTSNDSSFIPDSPDLSPDQSSNLDFSSLDTSRLHPLSGLNETLEYLVLEDEALNNLPGSETALPSRGWSDDLCYGTGTTYLTCLALGGSYGVVEGLRRSGPSDSFKLRLNTVLNAVTRRGPFLGNSGAVVAIIYNGINSTIGALRGRHDVFNSVGSGVLAGVLFKSTRGPRSAAVSGGIAGSAALLWSLGKGAMTSKSETAAALVAE